MRRRYKYKLPNTIRECWEEYGLIEHVENPNATPYESMDGFLNWFGNMPIKHKLRIWHKLTKPIRMWISYRKLKKMGIIK